MTPLTVTPAPTRSLSRRYALITPLIGGGPHAGAPDPDFPVTGKAARGQLRFWWRALRGGQFGGDLIRMRGRERELFGGASGAGEDDLPAAFSVTALPDPKAPTAPLDVPGLNTPLGYLTFGLRDKTHEVTGRPVKLLRGVRFTLEIEWQREPTTDDETELLAALWAWETFGGVGARTRRGFGALARTDADGSGDYEAQVRASLAQFLTPGPWPAGVPHLSAGDEDIVVQASTRTPDAEHAHLAGILKTFRRATHDGTARGATLWPEKRSIPAARTGAPQLFPRAALGLPIVFDKNGTLSGTHAERLASPVLFRPAQHGAQTYRVAARLHWTSTAGDPLGGDDQLTLTAGGRELAGQRHRLTWDEASDIHVLNRLPRPGAAAAPDVAHALMLALRS